MSATLLCAANGIWWSRWFDFNTIDVKNIVMEYELHGLPLDVFVLDMDWHTKQGNNTTHAPPLHHLHQLL